MRTGKYRIVYKDGMFIAQREVIYTFIRWTWTYWQTLTWGSDKYDASYSTETEAQEQIYKEIKTIRQDTQNHLRYPESVVSYTYI